MTLNQWAENGWLRPHRTSKQEISDLLKIVDRDLKDAQSGAISADWRFGIAYNAGLKLCTILLRAEGYRAGRTGDHYYTIQALPHILGKVHNEDARYLDTCRRNRNRVEYDSVGEVTEEDVLELIEFVLYFKKTGLSWLGKEHPELISGAASWHDSG